MKVDFDQSGSDESGFDESVPNRSGRKCFWMTVFLDEFCFAIWMKVDLTLVHIFDFTLWSAFSSV